jgi:predicted dehydrogenase
VDSVRIGVIGFGTMGGHHGRYLAKGDVAGATLAAVCDIDPAQLKAARESCGTDVALFDNADALLAANVVDAVIIATPHYFHPPMAIAAFAKGLHVMSEKPAGVYTKQVREMNEAAAASGKVFAVMFQARTQGINRKMREIVQSGELGEISRTTFVVTDWMRSQAYYNSGGWRATWAGEGGGVLINQCPHDLDFWQWTCGLPKRVFAVAGFGRYHHIEVEDHVTALVEYQNGATGTFVTTTGEAPGTRLLEIVGDNGKLVMEHGKITFYRNRGPVSTFIQESADWFAQPEMWKCDIPTGSHGEAHLGVTKNWVQAILKGTPLIARGEEGLNSLQLSNAMHLSAWTGEWADIPVDEDRYYALLQERIANSTLEKKVVKGGTQDLESSFH